MRYLSFDDVALVPTYSDLTSRTEPELTAQLTKNTKVSMPFFPSPMSSVISFEMGSRLVRRGIFPVFHRFYKDKADVEKWIDELSPACYISWGLENLPELSKLITTRSNMFFPKGVCLDVAHGHCLSMEKAIAYIKSNHPGLEVIAGTVCTPNATADLISWGADAVRVGIGGGAACTTRLVTGFGTPQFTTLIECSRIARKSRTPIIADGGIRNSRDISLALVAGASTVMMGKLFAATDESAAEAYGDHHKIYKGQASAEFQRTDRAPEGEQGLVKRSGSVDKLLDELSLNLKTALSYAGARTIEQFRERVQWVEVASGYGFESGTRFDVTENYLL